MSYTLPSITKEEVTFFSRYLYDLSGIMLGPEKGYLVENRFSPIMEELKCASYTELYFLSKNSSSKDIEKRLVDSIATHETYFFRDTAPFELLRQKILPDLIFRRKQQERIVDGVPMPLSVWSAACSTGQELYSIAIIIKELLGDFEQYSIKLLGTDISEKAIQEATCASYNDFEIKRGLSAERVRRFFIKGENGWEATREIKDITKFQKINLMDTFHNIGQFDIIFCRNVAVYFSQEDRIKLFKAIARVMHPESYLIVGSSESLNELSDIFIGTQQLGATFYRLRAKE